MTENRGGFHFCVNDGLAVEFEFGEMLMNAVMEAKPKNLVEVGTGHGYSTAWLLLGMEANGVGHLNTFDKEARTPQVWEELGLDKKNVTSHIGFFKDFKLEGEIDFLFHDSEHIFRLIEEDFERLVPLMAKKCQVWVHDCHGAFGDEVGSYFKSKGFDYRQVSDSYGIGIATRN